MRSLPAPSISPNLFLLAAVSLLALGCSGYAMPEFPPPTPSESAREIVQRAADAQGGDLFEAIADLSVSYEGEWGVAAPLIQPVLADKGHRKTSEERYLLDQRTIVQFHEGKKGSKAVLRDRDGVAVRYDGRVEQEEKRLSASALVADVYFMLITGPSRFLRDDVELARLADTEEDGVRYHRIAARLRPGFGFSEEDRATLWIDRETDLLRRVQFTLEGFARTRGAEVDVAFSDYEEIAGYRWPTRFDERIREPFTVFAHRWWLTGLDVDRGFEPADFELGSVEPDVVRPARPTGASTASVGAP